MASVLILGGTAEAAALARALAAAGHAVTTSLAGRLPEKPDLPGTLRVGGFGGVDGLTAYLRAETFDALIDATHPFAAVMPARARAACDALGLPRLVLRRPPWTPEPGDDWTEAADAAAAARLLAARPAARRILLTTGLTDLQAFAALADRTLVVRLIRPPDGPLPLPNAHVVTGRPHADAAAEGALMAAHGIDTLVTKNSGGAAGFGKIAAARARGAAMVVLARPPVEPGPAMETVGTAVAWLSANVA